MEIGRRSQIDRMTPAELAIRNAIAAVEEAGADIRLTDAVCLLSAAQTRVADYVDNIEGLRTTPLQHLDGSTGRPVPP